MLKKSHLLVLVAISAISYTLPFIAPRFWWLIFFFLVPIFLPFDINGASGEKLRLGFWHGFVWGVIAYGLQLYPAYGGVASLANRPSIYPFLLVTSLALYLSFYSGLWFWVMGRTKSLLISAVAATLYFHWIDAYSLWPLLRWEGYPFSHPLIPLTAHPALLFLLPVLGKRLCTFCIFIPAALTTFFLFSKSCKQKKINYIKKISCAIALLSCSALFYLPYFISSYHPHYKSQPPIHPCPDLSLISHLPLQAKGEPNSIAQLLSHKLKRSVRDNPEIQLVILPESALYTVLYSDLNAPETKVGIAGTARTGEKVPEKHSSPTCPKLWNAESLGKPISLVCGGFKKNKNNELLNTCYLFHDGALMQEYSKTHAVPFAEQIPGWFTWLTISRVMPSLMPSLESLFFSELSAIIPADNLHAPFIIPGVGEFIPVICSELFFSQQILGYEGVPILALVNDARFDSEIFRELMLKTAQIKAIEWQREILYISYAYGVYIGKNGEMWEIEREGNAKSRGTKTAFLKN